MYVYSYAYSIYIYIHISIYIYIYVYIWFLYMSHTSHFAQPCTTKASFCHHPEGECQSRSVSVFMWTLQAQIVNQPLTYTSNCALPSEQLYKSARSCGIVHNNSIPSTLPTTGMDIILPDNCRARRIGNLRSISGGTTMRSSSM